MQKLSYAILALLLILALGAVAGCGDDEDETADTETTAGAVDTTETTEAVQEGPETTDAGGAATDTTAADSTMQVDTASLYAENCAGCHGDQGQGIEGDGPNLTQIEEASRVETAIRNGADGMPAFEDQLSDEEITALSSHVVEELGM